MNRARKEAFEEWEKGGVISDENLSLVIRDLTITCEVFHCISKGPTLVGLYNMLLAVERMQEARRRKY